MAARRQDGLLVTNRPFPEIQLSRTIAAMEIFARCQNCGFVEFYPSRVRIECGECGWRLVRRLDLAAVGGLILRLQRQVHRLTQELLVERGERLPEVQNSPRSHFQPLTDRSYNPDRNVPDPDSASHAADNTEGE